MWQVCYNAFFHHKKYMYITLNLWPPLQDGSVNSSFVGSYRYMLSVYLVSVSFFFKELYQPFCSCCGYTIHISLTQYNCKCEWHPLSLKICILTMVSSLWKGYQYLSQEQLLTHEAINAPFSKCRRRVTLFRTARAKNRDLLTTLERNHAKYTHSTQHLSSSPCLYI